MLYSINVLADEVKTYKNAQDIETILKTIPINIKDMDYKNLNQRLPKLGLNVNLITVSKLQDSEIKISNGTYKKNDFLYTFFTNDPNEAVESICPIWNSFEFVKRGNKWIVDDLTSNFLISDYKCHAP